MSKIIKLNPFTGLNKNALSFTFFSIFDFKIIGEINKNKFSKNFLIFLPIYNIINLQK
jgi:hypothetical protein